MALTVPNASVPNWFSETEQFVGFVRTSGALTGTETVALYENSIASIQDLQTTVWKVDGDQFSSGISVLPDYTYFDNDRILFSEVGIGEVKIVQIGERYLNGQFESYQIRDASAVTKRDDLLENSYDSGTGGELSFVGFNAITLPVETIESDVALVGKRTSAWLDEYYLLVEAGPVRPDINSINGTDFAAFGRYMVAVGHPTGQRTASWGTWIDRFDTPTSYSPNAEKPSQEIVQIDTNFQQAVEQSKNDLKRTEIELERVQGDLYAARIKLEGLEDQQTYGVVLQGLQTLKLAGQFANLYLEYGTPIGRAKSALEQFKKGFSKGADGIALKDQFIKTIQDPSLKNLNESFIQTTKFVTKIIEYKGALKVYLDASSQLKSSLDYWNQTSDWWRDRSQLGNDIDRVRNQIETLEQRKSDLQNVIDQSEASPVTFKTSAHTLQIEGVQGREIYVFNKGTNTVIGSQSQKSAMLAKADADAALAAPGPLTDLYILTDAAQKVDVRSGSLIIDGALSSGDVANFAGSYKSYSVKQAPDDWVTVVNSRVDAVLHDIAIINFSDAIIGGAAANRFDGKGKNYRLDGGAGNDRYYVERGDTVVENAGGGTDTVFARGTYKLSAAAEVEVLTAASPKGRESFNLIGSNTSNKIVGNAGTNVILGLDGNDTVSGGAGDDKLDGGRGSDILSGGPGRDAFVFKTALDPVGNIDTIRDFRPADDTLYLDNAIFKKLGKTGALNKAFLSTTGVAKDKNDYLIYDKKTGSLYYDADGSGAGEAVRFASIQKNLKVATQDFLII